MNEQSIEKGISWAQMTWNCLLGCKPIDPKVCPKCWAQTFARRLSVNKRTPYYHNLITDGEWNGQSKFMESRLYEPLRIKESTWIVCGLMGDPFLSAQNFPYLEKILTVCKMAPWHKFLFLTRRPNIAATFFHRKYVERSIGFPLPNVGIGISVEDNDSLTKRAPLILDIPAAFHFLSYEPSLGDLPSLPLYLRDEKKRFQWVLMGGQSGPGSEPMPRDRAIFVRDLCIIHGIKFHFKQWGSFLPEIEYIERFGPGKRAKRVEFMGEYFYKMSKEKAGRTLDGREWIDFPEVQTAIPPEEPI